VTAPKYFVLTNYWNLPSGNCMVLNYKYVHEFCMYVYMYVCMYVCMFVCYTVVFVKL
jgi:hypothetical protein